MRKKCIPALVLATVLPSAIVAQQPIFWNSARPLVWSDFHGRVRPSANGEQVAETMSVLSWSFQYELNWSSQRCEFSLREISTTASFDPSGSWVRAGNETVTVLQHEQLHFDITELYRRRFVAIVAPYIEQSHSCQSRSSRRAARDAEQGIRDLVQPLYEDIWQAHLDTQADYDQETGHGTNEAAQSSWSARIAGELANTPAD